jgi:tRNA(Ile)-lysidine synthase TilS/MesJ
MGLEIGYSHWRDEFKSILESFSGKKVFLLFSGGKDSSLALDFLLRASKEFNFIFEAHAGAFPVHRYTDKEKNRIESYWRKRGAEITWHELGETDDSISKSVNPCLPCRELRRKALQTMLPQRVDEWERVVLVTSYSLWDIVSYTLEHILSDIFSYSENTKDSENNKRFVETAQRYYPALKMKEGYTVFRPLIKYNGGDIIKLLEQNGIPSLSIPCRFSGFRPKRILEKYYEKMGLHFNYNDLMNFVRNRLEFPDISSYISMEQEEYLRHIF